MNEINLFPTITPLSLTVSELNRYVRQLLESDDVLQGVWVRGEISNLSRPKSGHIYLTLKDDTASLRCVIWRTQAAQLRVPLRDGQAIEALGSIGVYEQGGQYQLYISAVRAVGEGFLYQEFLRLKAKLEAEGLFEPERKRPIPQWPKRIGVVTSPTGAALQDMLNTLRSRFPLAEVLLAPCSVQGEAAPLEIVDAVVALNRIPNLDVILVARGGGSMEDLWAFNDERVVRTIAASAVPVITGVGHETDFTLVDFVADLRAPTPTGAAVQATPNMADLKLDLSAARRQFSGAYLSVLSGLRDRLQDTTYRFHRGSPLQRILNNRQRLDEFSERAQRALVHQFRLKQTELAGKKSRLTSLNPLAILGRGYAVVSQSDGTIIHSVQQTYPGQSLQVRVADGQFNTEVKPKLG